jgi:hypothetical protein
LGAGRGYDWPSATGRPRLAVREEHLSGQKVVFDDLLREIADQEAAIIVQE